MKNDTKNLNYDQKCKNKIEKIAHLLKAIYKKEDKFFVKTGDGYERS